MTKRTTTPGYVFGSARATQTLRDKRGLSKMTKLPTSLDELKEVLHGDDQEGNADTGSAVVETSA